jgi:hypothetical protein
VFVESTVTFKIEKFVKIVGPIGLPFEKLIVLIIYYINEFTVMN